MSIFMIGRLTRSEEESGRLDLVRATVVGRHAPTIAALAVVAAMNAVVAAAVIAATLALGLPVAGSLLFGACFAAVGFAFAGIASVTAQISENTRVAYGLAGAVLGAAFALRAAGDAGNGSLSWASIIGWAQKTRPYAGERLWPLALLVGLTIGSLVLAAVLSVHRDVGGGIVRPRPGPAHAAPVLGRSWGLPVRLNLGSVGWWAVGVALLGVAYGSVAENLEQIIGDNQALRDFLVASGITSLTDAYFSTTLFVLALVAGGFAVQASVRLRTEESALRAEPLLATPLSRVRWMMGHLAVAFVGSAVVVLAGGLGVGIAYAVVAGEPGQVVRLTVASAAEVPAVWVLVGIVAALFGLLPRATTAAWAALAACFVVGFLGEVLDLPHWVRQISPFEHVPSVPGGHVTMLPLLALVAIAAGGTLVGIGGFEHRDVG